MFRRAMILSLLTALTLGCVSKPEPVAPVIISDHCYKDAPLFYSRATKEFLLANDEEFLRDVVTHNETYVKLCPKVEN